MMDTMVPVLAGTLAAATPLIFAGLGELVAERSGVINLGVEGMILIGAIAGFAAAAETGLGPAAGLPAGALVGFAAGAAVPTGLVLIPNARIVNSVSMAASAPGALVAANTIVQLTE